MFCGALTGWSKGFSDLANSLKLLRDVSCFNSRGLTFNVKFDFHGIQFFSALHYNGFLFIAVTIPDNLLS